MIVDLNDLSDDRSYTFSYELADTTNLFGERLLRLETPILVSGSYLKSEDNFLIDANIKISAVFNCDRCLTEIHKNLTILLNEKIVKENDSNQDLNFYTYKDFKVNLDDILKEKLLLNFPEYVVCKEDCQGLCQVCGCDLNINKCSCQLKDYSENKPFASLQEFTSGGNNGSTKKKNI